MQKRNRAKNRKKGDNSRGGWIYYVMIHFPLFIFWKAGITSNTPWKRAKAIDPKMLGFPVPIMFTVIPFGAYWFEQQMKSLCEPFKVEFYKGDGHTEWFVLPGGVLIFTCVLIVNTMWCLLFLAIINNFHHVLNFLYD